MTRHCGAKSLCAASLTAARLTAVRPLVLIPVLAAVGAVAVRLVAIGLVAVGLVATGPAAMLAGHVATLHAQGNAHAADAAAIMKADADFATSVADHDKARFLTFIADVTTFNGGSTSEIHGRDAVMKDWSDFFDPNGPTLSWMPIKAEVFGAGDLGYSTGRSVFRSKGQNGAPVERLGEYLTVWRKQRDGAWRVVFDTGSTLPPAAK
jgi:ketosteroid isomerase-like protein